MEIIDVDNYIAIQTCNPLFMDINTGCNYSWSREHRLYIRKSS